MTSRIFRVDLSEASRDFAHLATEPGLAMLDSQGVNYKILYKWLGSYVADPERQGDDLIGFYIREEERGRLENVTCAPATKKDLQGPLKSDLEAIEAGIRKAKPESATEQLLHRILSKKFKELTADLDSSDFSCHFFKYRAAAEPWRLVWCWGYQRKDLEPSKAVICSNPDCHQLFAHRPKTKRRCPACATVVQKKRRGVAAVLSPRNLLIALLLLLGLFLWFNQPKLVVTPETWEGPRGSRVEFNVVDQRWFFFRSDVSKQAVSQSWDTKIFEFEHGTQGKAKAKGNSRLSFRHGNLISDATVSVVRRKPPEKMTIEPAEIKIAVGSTERVKVIGHYKNNVRLDLTDDCELAVKDDKIAYATASRVFGEGVGTTVLTATYRAIEKDEPQTATANEEKGKLQTATAKVDVADIEYKSLAVALDTNPLAVGQTAQLEVFGVTADGQKYDLIGSKKLNIAVEPLDAVSLDDQYVTGKKTGPAKVIVTWKKLEKSLKFDVGDSLLAAGTFVVQPAEVEMAAGTYRDLDVVAASAAEIKVASKNPEIVEVIEADTYTLSAYKVGETTITFTQDGNKQVVKVKVIPNDFIEVRIEPPLITAHVGEPTDVTVVGVREDLSTEMIAPDQFEVIQQPRTEYADFDRIGMTMFGVQPTPEDQKLVLKFGQLPEAEAVVRVVERGATAVADMWAAHPPLHVRPAPMVVGGPMAIGGGTAIYDPRVGGLVWQTVPPGLAAGGVVAGDQIVSIGGVDVTGVRNPALLQRYIDRLGPDGVISVRGAGGLVDISLAAARLRAFEDIQLNYAKEQDVTGTDFAAELNFNFREAGNYRVTDAEGQPLSDWAPFAAGAPATINTARIPRVPGKSKYRIYVERDIDGVVERFPFSVALEQGE